MYGYIYKTTNLINNKIYVGKHKAEQFDETYKGSGVLFTKAVEKYGWENFSCEILAWASTLEELNQLERFWVAELSARDLSIGYNLCEGGGGTDGYQHTEEAKLKMSKAKLGKPLTPEWIANREASRKAHGNTKHSEEARKRMSEAQKGHKVSKETREKLRQANLGQVVSEETKAKLKAARAKALESGRWKISDEGMQRLKEAGSRPKSAEHNKHLSETRIKKKLSAGKNNPRAKKVYCYETDKIYSWAGEAAEELHLSIHSIRQCCQGKRKDVKGYHFKHI